ncbi:MAG: hypothetical protein JWO31_1324 [Phycisphaerales bacterium]|nr:hypothetical protein [Phycisphaerales bacterium]
MDAIKVDPEIMHGTPCFAGTRVPVVSLFEHLAAGYGLDYFIYQFPTVRREQAEAVIEHAKRVVVGPLEPEWARAGRP